MIRVAVLVAGQVRALVLQVFCIPPRPWSRRSAWVAGPQEGDLVKRVIALPGQTICSSGSSIDVNGRLLRLTGYGERRYD
jgi:type IV secretory pathway protease TraF